MRRVGRTRTVGLSEPVQTLRSPAKWSSSRTPKDPAGKEFPLLEPRRKFPGPQGARFRRRKRHDAIPRPTRPVQTDCPGMCFHQKGGVRWSGRRSRNHDPSCTRMLKKSASFVLGSPKSSTYPQEGTPPVSTRLRPCWTVFLSILRGAFLLPHMCGYRSSRCLNIVFHHPATLRANLSRLTKPVPGDSTRQ